MIFCASTRAAPLFYPTVEREKESGGKNRPTLCCLVAFFLLAHSARRGIFTAEGDKKFTPKNTNISRPPLSPTTSGISTPLSRKGLPPAPQTQNWQPGQAQVSRHQTLSGSDQREELLKPARHIKGSSSSISAPRERLSALDVGT